MCNGPVEARSGQAILRGDETPVDAQSLIPAGTFDDITGQQDARPLDGECQQFGNSRPVVLSIRQVPPRQDLNERLF